MKDKQTFFFTNKWGTHSATYYPPNISDSIHSIIVFVHGFRAKKEWYNWIGECLASQGYPALLFTVPSASLPNPYQWSDGIKSAIDYLFSMESQLQGEVRLDRIGAMGHSMGGLGALIAGGEDRRIGCIVGLAPAIMPDIFPILKEFNNISIPIQLQIGSNDGLIPPENVKAFFNGLSSTQKSYIEIEGGNHIRFLDKSAISIAGEYISRLGTIGRHFKDRSATITFEEQHSVSGNRFLEWFDHYLKH